MSDDVAVPSTIEENPSMESVEINKIERAIECGNRVFVIRGAAGTGKTTLVKLLIPVLLKKGFNTSLLTPTGRAALVLSKRTVRRINYTLRCF